MSKIPENVKVIDLTVEDEKNKDFISQWKRNHGVMRQSTMQTKAEAMTAWVFEQGWTVRDMRAWNAIVDAVKFEKFEGAWSDPYKLLYLTLDLAEHLQVHPIGMLCFARVEHKIMQWDLEGLEKFKAVVIPDSDQSESESNDETEGPTTSASTCPGAPKRRRTIRFVEDEAGELVEQDDDCTESYEVASQKYQE